MGSIAHTKALRVKAKVRIEMIIGEIHLGRGNEMKEVRRKQWSSLVIAESGVRKIDGIKRMNGKVIDDGLHDAVVNTYLMSE